MTTYVHTNSLLIHGKIRKPVLGRIEAELGKKLLRLRIVTLNYFQRPLAIFFAEVLLADERDQSTMFTALTPLEIKIYKFIFQMFSNRSTILSVFKTVVEKRSVLKVFSIFQKIFY